MAPSDGALVGQVLVGERQAFGLLVERYGALVHALILERVRRRDEVEDLVQEAFCSAYQALPRLRQPSRFAPWLCQIARATALHWVRHEGERSHVESSSDAWLPVGGPVPDEEMEREERVHALWATLDQLPDDTRQLVVLHYLEGCSYRQIARFLGIPVTTVRWRLLRAQGQVTRGVTRLLGESTRAWQTDRRRLSIRILAGLPLSLPLTRQAEAIGRVAWALGRLSPLLKLVVPALAGVGLLAGLMDAVIGGNYPAALNPGGASAASAAPTVGVRLRLDPGRPAAARGSAWARPPVPPSAAGLTPWVAAAPAAVSAPLPQIPLAGADTARLDEKPTLPAPDPQRVRPKPAILTVITVQYNPPAPNVSSPDALAIPRLLEFLHHQPGITFPTHGDRLPLGAPGMKAATLLYLPARDHIELSEEERRALGEYLKAGVLLFVDGMYPDPFERQLKAYIAEPLVLGEGDQKWQSMPRDHGLYSCFYDFPHGLPQGRSSLNPGEEEMEMLELRGRIAVLLSHLDLTWYWTDEFASRRYEEGLRFGVNLLVYAWSQQMSR